MSRTISGVRFDLISCESAIQAIQQWSEKGEQNYVVVTNPHSVMLCRRDREMCLATKSAGLVLPDGVGVVLAARLLGYKHSGRVTGPALMLNCCDWGRRFGFRHFFYGGKPGVAEKLAERLSSRFAGLQVAGSLCPPFRKLTDEEDAEIVERMNAARATIVWVGLGAPKQEKWMAGHLGRVQAAAMIGVGAAFDFHAGTARWAPRWMRMLGLEWLYRLYCAPRRMWRRNLDSPLFLLGVLRQRVWSILYRHEAVPGQPPDGKPEGNVE